MNNQVNNGRAFEWSIAVALEKKTSLKIDKNNASNLAEKSYNLLDKQKGKSILDIANIAIEHILEKESLNSKHNGVIKFNSDKSGEQGDVRDIIISLNNKRTIGISCKHNHSALKHSRLSDQIDFVKKWGINQNGCSDEYWKSIKPIFSDLRKIKQESSGKALWAELLDKANKYYWPILRAWEQELNRVKRMNQNNEKNLCETLLRYLVGKNDFYKVIKRDRNKVNIQCWNFNGTLSPPKTRFPSSIISINEQNGGQYSKTIIFNRGYSLNFRLHNASSKVEPSLKFDITAIGLPAEQIYQQTLNVKGKAKG